MKHIKNSFNVCFDKERPLISLITGNPAITNITDFIREVNTVILVYEDRD